ncbi:MAG: XdhC family protein [Burkholderiales bacterium]
MHSVDLEVLRQAATWFEQGLSVTLVTVVKTFGSSPRPPGAMLAVCQDGRLAGSVSGGCIEDDLIIRLKAGEDIKPTPEVVTYGVSSEEARRFGLPCGGTLQLVLEPLQKNAQGSRSWSEVLARIERREVVARKLDIATGNAEIVEATLTQDLDFDDKTLTTVHGPRWRIGVIGAGQLSVYVAQFAQALDYNVFVCDPREEYRLSWDMPGVEVSKAMPDDFVTALKADSHTAIVALTHDPKQDDLALLEALKSDSFYVGALGSKKNQQARRERLAEFELSPAQIAKMRGPVGLQIGSKIPSEMAIAILADITAVRNGIELVSVSKASPQDKPKLSAVG